MAILLLKYQKLKCLCQNVKFQGGKSILPIEASLLDKRMQVL